MLTLVFLNPNMSCLCKQCRSEEANWSGSALFAIQYFSLYQQPGASNLIYLKIRSGCGILIYSAWKRVKSYFLGEVRKISKNVVSWIFLMNNQALSIGTGKHDQTVYTQIRSCRIWHASDLDLHCLPLNTAVLDKSTSNEMKMFKF